MEKNKTGKYLKYAIGEIVLVVIGILIALSINNWNENQKNKSKELKILKELKSELISNKYRLYDKAEFFNKTKRNGKLVENHLTNRLAYNDSLQRYFSIPLDNFSFLLAYSAYENLKSQGFDNITNDKLRLSIIRLYDEKFGLIKDQEIKMSNIFTTTSVPLTIKYFRTTLSKGLVPNDYDKLLNTSEFTNLISQLAYASGDYEAISKNTAVEIDRLLKEIEAEINNKE
ncbi:DUF6090 family protein [Winogradskyella aurantia]|uniref:Uncharacterized protein n=1 Tax=Winogradskyella aurantia TaxID=1915063 RepID=A0A265UXS5_9FLAO|nr:DUF6090 family protein [Winogradskyella aurantia]OZV70101.1 hypothetical protein CA834_05640 [Winogradskyella aurantia]